MDCGLCEKVCPILHSADNIIRYNEAQVFAAYTKDDDIRTDSTSGGIHSMLAQAMYNKNAYVGGAVYNEEVDKLANYIREEKIPYYEKLERCFSGGVIEWEKRINVRESRVVLCLGDENVRKR